MKCSNLLICGLLALISTHGQALNSNLNYSRPQIKDSIIIQLNEIDYGIVEIGKSRKFRNTRSASGSQHYAFEYKFRETNDEIPAAKGTTFGIEWSVISNSSSPVLLKTVWRFPRPIRNAANQLFKEEIQERYQQPNSKILSYYFLEESFEVIPGEWWFEVYYEGQLIYKRKFILKEII